LFCEHSAFGKAGWQIFQIFIAMAEPSFPASCGKNYLPHAESLAKNYSPHAESSAKNIQHAHCALTNILRLGTFKHLSKI